MHTTEATCQSNEYAWGIAELKSTGFSQAWPAGLAVARSLAKSAGDELSLRVVSEIVCISLCALAVVGLSADRHNHDSILCASWLWFLTTVIVVALSPGRFGYWEEALWPEVRRVDHRPHRVPIVSAGLTSIWIATALPKKMRFSL